MSDLQFSITYDKTPHSAHLRSQRPKIEGGVPRHVGKAADKSRSVDPNFAPLYVPHKGCDVSLGYSVSFVPGLSFYMFSFIVCGRGSTRATFRCSYGSTGDGQI